MCLYHSICVATLLHRSFQDSSLLGCNLYHRRHENGLLLYAVILLLVRIQKDMSFLIQRANFLQLIAVDCVVSPIRFSLRQTTVLFDGSCFMI